MIARKHRLNSLQLAWRRLTPLGWLCLAVMLVASIKLVLLVADLAPAIAD